jgi:hypothetical protein
MSYCASGCFYLFQTIDWTGIYGSGIVWMKAYGALAQVDQHLPGVR